MREFYRHLSIAGKLRLLMTTACLFGIGLTGATLIVAEWFMVRARMAEATRSTAVVMAENAAAAVAFRSRSEAANSLRALLTDADTVGAVIFEANGEEFARAGRENFSGRIPPAPGPEAQHSFNAPRMYVWVPIKTPEGRMLGTLAVERSQGPLYRRIGAFAAVTGAIMVVAGVLAFILSNWLQHFFSRPVLELAATAARVTAERDFSLRATRSSDDEFGDLADAFNTMVADVQAGHTEADALYRRVRAHAHELEARVELRTRELKEAYRELESFSYSVSHDLRAPLRAIAVYTEVLLEDSDSRLTPEAVQHARRIVAAVARMNGLIDGLLDLARLSKRDLQIELIEIGDLARDVVAELSPNAADRAVRVTVHEMQPCFGDPVLVRQVLLNLVGNAFKYSRERNPAEITLGEIAANEPHERVYFVRDNGAGFSMQHASRLFQVFERLHESRRFEGSGVGLATSKRIVERHGGRIWAEAEPERGATFYFTLPATGERGPPPGETKETNGRAPTAPAGLRG